MTKLIGYQSTWYLLCTKYVSNLTSSSEMWMDKKATDRRRQNYIPPTLSGIIRYQHSYIPKKLLICYVFWYFLSPGKISCLSLRSFLCQMSQICSKMFAFPFFSPFWCPFLVTIAKMNANLKVFLLNLVYCSNKPIRTKWWKAFSSPYVGQNSTPWCM